MSRLLLLLLPLTACGTDDPTPTDTDIGVDAADPLALPVDAPGPYRVGYTVRSVTYTPPVGPDRTIDVHLWYPTLDEDGEETRYSGYAPTTGTFLDATVAPADDPLAPYAGGRPVFVHSHGDQAYGGSANHLFRHLASHGWVAAAPDHVDNMLFANVQPTPPLHWVHRPSDITASMDALVGDEVLGPTVDGTRFVVSGHSRGGTTVWSVLGASFDAADATASGGWCPGCTMDQQTAVAGADLADPRAEAGVLLATGVRDSLFGTTGIDGLTAPILLMTGSEDGDGGTGAWADLTAADLDATWVQIDGGCHETFNLGAPCGSLDAETGFGWVQPHALAFVRHTLLGDDGVSAADWTTRTVNLTGIADLFPEDPEPEFVDINKGNIAAVTLQENNHIVLVNLVTGTVIGDFSAGAVDLEGIDTIEDDIIRQVDSLAGVPREPDSIKWVGPLVLATADEGDLFGGSRGFTTFLSNGTTLFEAGSTVEYIVTRHGHYPENRSENKGNEPEGMEFSQYGDADYLFVGSERANLVLVYEIPSLPPVTLFPPFYGALQPRFVQALPSGSGPEGLLAIPQRDLFVVACENDSRDDALRSVVAIYQRNAAPNYPTIASADLERGRPIPWAALSGLAVDPADASRAYTIHDSFYRESRVYTVDMSSVPAVIDGEIVMRDDNGLLLTALQGLKKQLPGTDDFDPASIVNADGTVNLDLEGVTVDPTGAIWVCSEGTGNLEGGVSDPDSRPFESPNVVARIDAAGVIDFVALPPVGLTANQFRFGLEGIAAVDLGKAGVRVAVAFQRAWGNAGDPGDRARIGLLDPATGDWTFAYYPLDAVESANGGWIGLGDLVSFGGELIVLERDNNGGPDAAVKRIHRVAFDAADFGPDSPTPGKDFTVLGKQLVRDLLLEGDFAVTGGLVPEKLEGMMVMPDGTVWIVNDNDGVDDNNGETQLLNLGDLLD